MHDFIRSPDLLFIFQLAPSPAYVNTVFLDKIWTKLCPSILIGRALERNCYEFCIRNALSESSLRCLPLTVNYISISLKIYIFSQHQPLVFTNLDKANVAKHKVVRNYLPNYLQRLCTRYRWVLILYATEHCYLNSQKRHVSAHFYFQILNHWDFKINPGGKLRVFNLPCSNC